MASEKNMVYKLCNGKLICEELKIDDDGRTHYYQFGPCNCGPYDSRDIGHSFIITRYDSQHECYCCECEGQSFAQGKLLICNVPECYYPRWWNNKKKRFSLTCSKTCAKKLGIWRHKMN